MDEVVEGDGGADVRWDASEGGADGEVRGEGGFEDEVFLVVHDGDGVGEGGEDDARVGHFRGDGFVAEVEAEEVRGGFADDAAEEDGGVEEVEVGEFAAVSGVPEDAGAGAGFDVRAMGVEGEGGGAAGDDDGDGEAVGEEGIAEVGDGSEGGVAGGGAFCGIGLMEVAIVGVESGWGEAGERGDELVESSGVRARGDAGAVLTGVDIEEDWDCEVVGGGGGAELAEGGFVVGDGGEADGGEFARQVEEAVDGWADEL